jgi:CheY-like chemotaxis protein
VARLRQFGQAQDSATPETVDLDTALREAAEFTRTRWENEAQADGRRIEVRIDSGPGVWVTGRSHEMREVFANLILNAVDALPRGGVILLRAAVENGRASAWVEDNGVGMSLDVQRRVFDPFFTTKNVKGTGLGLSVAYGIVSRHRGTIEVNSRPGLGTEFVLGFPPGEGVLQMPAPAPDGPLPLFRVLVVDDEEPVLSVLADLLRALGQDVVQALGGAAGLAAFREREFDVVFSDLGMPEVNGWDLALAIKSERPATAVVLATGWGYQLEGTTAQAHGVDLVMPKPFSLEDVERVLRQLRESAVSGPMAA